MNVLSTDVPDLFPCERDGSDSETIELALMGEQERYQIEAELKRLTDKIRDQQDLLNKRECDFKEEATNLKAQLEEGNKVRRLLKDKEDQCQKLQHEVTSLRKEVNERSTTIKKLRDRSSYYENLEATILSLKGDLEESRKQNKDLHQAIEKQDNEVISLNTQLECAFRVREMLQDLYEEQEKEILKLREQMEEGRRVEEDLKKQSLEKEEQLQVEVNILKGKLEEKDKLLRFQDSSKVLDDILNSQRSPAINTGLGFHEFVEGESSSQGEARNSKEKSKVINEEMKDPSHQQLDQHLVLVHESSRYVCINRIIHILFICEKHHSHPYKYHQESIINLIWTSTMQPHHSKMYYLGIITNHNANNVLKAYAPPKLVSSVRSDHD